MCGVCQDWFLKCQNISQQHLPHHVSPNHQELLHINDSMANGIYVDQKEIMRVMVGSMLQIVNQNHLVTQLQEETKNLCDTVKNLEDNLLDTKVKVYNLEYDVQKLNGFSASDSIVIRNLEIPISGNDKKLLRKLLKTLELRNLNPKKTCL